MFKPTVLVVFLTASFVYQKAASAFVLVRSSPFQLTIHPSKTILSAWSNQNNLPPPVETINSSEEFDLLFTDEKEKLIVIKFYAEFCKTCQAIASSYNRMARKDEYGVGVRFVQIPLNKETRLIFKDLDVKTVPSGRIYCPHEGLVQEHSIGTRTNFNAFEKILRSCVLKDVIQ